MRVSLRHCPAFVVNREESMYSALAPNEDSAHQYANEEKDGTGNASTC